MPETELIVTAPVIRFGPPLSVRLRSAVMNVDGSIGLEKVTPMVSTTVFRTLGDGPERETMVGGVRSMVAVKSPGCEMFPARSIAVTVSGFAPAGRLSAMENDVPLTVASPRSVLPSWTSTMRLGSDRVPVSVTDPESVRPSVDEMPLSGEIARFAGAGGGVRSTWTIRSAGADDLRFGATAMTRRSCSPAESIRASLNEVPLTEALGSWTPAVKS